MIALTQLGVLNIDRENLINKGNNTYNNLKSIVSLKKIFTSYYLSKNYQIKSQLNLISLLHAMKINIPCTWGILLLDFLLTIQTNL